MKQIYVDLIQFRGSHYAFGLKQGKSLRDSLILKNRKDQWKVRRPLFTIDIHETEEIFKRFAPYLWEELIGLKDGLQWPMERVLLEFGGYRLTTPRSGCSIYVGEHFFIRNYDYHPKTYEGRYVLYQPDDHGLATMGMSQKITGRSDGINEKGLVMAYNFVNRRRPGDGFVCHMIGRIILETCSTIEEAVHLLQEIPHRGSFNYVLFEQKSSEASIVEASPRSVNVRSGAMCTNHFDLLLKENRHVLNDSEERLSIIKRHHQKGITAKEAFRIFNDPKEGIFSVLQ